MIDQQALREQIAALKQMPETAPFEILIALAEEYFELLDKYAELEEQCGIDQMTTRTAELLWELPEGFCFMHTEKTYLIRSYVSRHSPSYCGENPLAALEQWKALTSRKSKRREVYDDEEEDE